jgi:hypothetical protein
MRFMMVILSNPAQFSSDKPAEVKDKEAFYAMGRYNDELKKAGILLAMDGLTPPAMGARFTFKGGKAKITDGPFTEAKEVIAGYWMIEVKSKEEAYEWASRIPCMEDGIVEVRRVVEIADFDQEIQKKFADSGSKLGNQK